MHAYRAARYGDPLIVPPNAAARDARRAGTPRLCRIEGCDREVIAKGLCCLHYQRLRKHGDPLHVRPVRGWSISNGYVRMKMPDSPIADARGFVFQHRHVLHLKIGPGVHPCEWCGRLVDWSKRHPHDADALVVDHLDRCRTNNHPDNLVPACSTCNADRDYDVQEAGAVPVGELPPW